MASASLAERAENPAMLSPPILTAQATGLSRSP